MCALFASAHGGSRAACLPCSRLEAERALAWPALQVDDPQQLVPKLPQPRDLMPFPQQLAMKFIGHESRVRRPFQLHCSNSAIATPDSPLLCKGDLTHSSQHTTGSPAYWRR